MQDTLSADPTSRSLRSPRATLTCGLASLAQTIQTIGVAGPVSDESEKHMFMEDALRRLPFCQISPQKDRPVEGLQ